MNMTITYRRHNDFRVWVMSGIAEHDSKDLFMFDCILEDTREER